VNYELWGDKYDVSNCAKMVEEADKEWMELSEHHEIVLTECSSIKNYVGDYFETKVEQIMIHLG
jgi:hypothetical protein